MLRTFKITFMHQRGSFYQCRLIEAETVTAALKRLGEYWTVKSITVLCNGTIKDGTPCELFSYEDYCHHHREAA